MWKTEKPPSVLSRALPTVVTRISRSRRSIPRRIPISCWGPLQAQVKDALERPRVLPPAQIGDPAGAPGFSARRLPSSLLEARDALAADHGLEAAMGPLLHGSLLDSLDAEIQRVQQLPDEDQVNGCCWWPLVGGLA